MNIDKVINWALVVLALGGASYYFFYDELTNQDELAELKEKTASQTPDAFQKDLQIKTERFSRA